MNVFLIMSVIGTMSLQNVFKKHFDIYGRPNFNGKVLFNFISAVISFLFFWGINGFRFTVDGITIRYALEYAVFYVMGTLGELLAIQTGPLSLTALVTSYGLLVPCGYGLMVLKEPVTMSLVLGLILLALALLLQQGKGEGNISIQPIWWLMVFMSFAGNGGCLTVQKAFQMNNVKMNVPAFMMVTMLFVCCINGLVLLITKRRKADRKHCLCRQLAWAVPSALSNAATNLLIMILNVRVAASLLFPLVAGGSIILTFLFAVTVHGEHMGKKQYVGFALGVVALVLINMR